MAAHQAPPSLGFSRQEHWSGLPFPSPMHESERWKWSCSVDPMDCSLPGCSIHGIFQARVLEWGAIAFSMYRKYLVLKANLFKFYSRILLRISVSIFEEWLFLHMLLWKQSWYAVATQQSMYMNEAHSLKNHNFISSTSLCSLMKISSCHIIAHSCIVTWASHCKTLIFSVCVIL